jgi:hypothetical protein
VGPRVFTEVGSPGVPFIGKREELTEGAAEPFRRRYTGALSLLIPSLFTYI